MTADVHLTALACALGAVVFATISANSRAGVVLAGLAFVATLAWPPAASLPGAIGATGLVAAAAAVATLTRRMPTEVLGLLAGWLAASWAVLLRSEGLPLWAAAPLALAVPCVAAVQSRRSSFAPPRLCEDALVIVALVAVGAAAAPGLAEGWRAAVNLKFDGAEQTAAAVPAWAVAVSVGAMAAGAGYAAWSRR